ncbi:hypothetical protein J437_LFUL003511 [Ladona fulva]|uniref:Uncharacterized protein n=1 Tax=Ladona fulva TaxID=123851 RepID=A0A8K0JUY3_LADFU|nr:hypothetical protein J437_LFUL003511 [Ladona fulva]
MPDVADRLGVPEISRDGFSKISVPVAAEFVGTLLLTFFGVSSTVSWPDSQPALMVVQISLCFGLATSIIIQALGHISGAHINPAVTLAMMITSNIPILRALLYVIAQCIGAIVGIGILKALTPGELGENLGMTLPDSRLTAAQAFGMEFMLGLVLVMVVFAVCDPHRNLSSFAPNAVGLAQWNIFSNSLTQQVCLKSEFQLPYTGASMNPAVSLGAAAINGDWSHHWVRSYQFCLSESVTFIGAVRYLVEWPLGLFTSTYSAWKQYMIMPNPNLSAENSAKAYRLNPEVHVLGTWKYKANLLTDFS